MLKVTFHKQKEIPDSEYKFAVIVSKYQNKWIFCKHKQRTTWEIPGGHRELGETINEAAKREFPNGNSPYQITTRILEECGEVASEVNHFEKSGIKSLKHGEPSKQHLADEIKQAINALVQLAVYYNVETELEESIDRSLAKMKNENLL